MTLKVEQNPKKTMARDDTRRQGKAREDTTRHEKARQGTRRHGHEGTGHEGTEYILLETLMTTGAKALPQLTINHI